MRAVVLSVAHSHRARGSSNERFAVNEYDVSVRATDAALGVLRQRDCPVVVLDAGDNPVSRYDDIKVEAINALNPSLAVEIHCNSNEDKRARYGEVIHHPRSPYGMRAAVTIGDELRDALGNTKHLWPWHGARAWALEKDVHRDFFLDRTNCPSVIVEGLFISNDEQAEWLASPGGAEAYGMLVGEGVALFLQREGL